MTKSLFVVSECAPLVKTGGLADVAGALPAALAAQGVEVRVLLPGYRTVLKQLGKTKTIARYDELFGGAAKLLACTVAGIDLLILDAPHLYDRDGAIYGDATGQDLITVFVPTTPNPTSGFILFVPKEEVKKMDMDVEDALKLVMSLGVVTPERNAKIPTQKPE